MLLSDAGSNTVVPTPNASSAVPTTYSFIVHTYEPSEDGSGDIFCSIELRDSSSPLNRYLIFVAEPLSSTSAHSMVLEFDWESNPDSISRGLSSLLERRGGVAWLHLLPAMQESIIASAYEWYKRQREFRDFRRIRSIHDH